MLWEAPGRISTLQADRVVLISPRPARWGQRGERRLWIVALASPLPLALLGVRWTQTAAGFIDPWMYQGYFDWFGGLGLNYDNYKTSRVPWLLVGWLANNAVGPYWAQVVIAMGFLSVSAVLAFLIARYVLDAWAALAVGVGFAYWPYLMHGGGAGWLYHNPLLGPALLLGIWAVLWALTTQTLAKQVVAGVLLGSTFLCVALLTTHAVLVFTAFVACLLASQIVGSHSWRQFALRTAGRLAAGAALGLVVSYVAYGTVTALCSNRGFWFHKPLWAWLELQRLPQNKAIWWLPMSTGWLGDAAYLSFIPVTCVLAAIAVATRMRRRKTSGRHQNRNLGISIGLMAGGVIGTASYILLYSLGYQSLDSRYLSFPVQIAGLMLVVGSLGLLRRKPTATDERRARQESLSRFWAPAAVLLPVAFLALSSQAYLALSFGQSIPVLVQASIWNGAIAIVLCLGLVATRRAPLQITHFVVPVAIMAIALPSVWGYAGELATVQPGSGVRTTGLDVLDVRAALMQSAQPGSLPNPPAAVIWADPVKRESQTSGTLDAEATAASVLTSLHTASSISGNFMPSPRFSQLPAKTIRGAALSGSLVLLSPDPARLAMAVRRVEQVAPTVHISTKQLGSSDDGLWIATVR